MVPEPEASEVDRPSRRWSGAGAVLLLTSVPILLQLLTPVPWDADTGYHVAVGRLVAHHGVLSAFPWTPFSWLSDHYADKELLLHLLLAPLSALRWVTAAKIAGAVLGAGLLVALWRVLAAERVPRAALWALLPLAASGAFVLRFALVRPHLASVALALTVVWAAARGRLAILAAASLLYPWTYIAFHLPVVLVVLVEAARAAARQRPRVKPLLVAAGAVLAGIAVHPHAANLLRFWWLVHVEILGRTAWAARPGFELGQEFQPFGALDAARFVLLPAAAVAAAGVLAWRRRREDALPLAFAGVAGAFLCMTLASSRFIEYLAPFAAAALALALGARAARWAAPALGGAFLFTAALGAGPVLALGTRGDDVPPPFIDFVQKRIPPGDQVFTCEWGLTGELMVALPERRFIVALDPVLFHAKDPALYRLWAALPREGPPDAAAQIRSRFGARWVLCAARPESLPLLRRLGADPGVRPVLASPLWYLYDLGAPPGPLGPALAPAPENAP